VHGQARKPGRGSVEDPSHQLVPSIKERIVNRFPIFLGGTDRAVELHQLAFELEEGGIVAGRAMLRHWVVLLSRAPTLCPREHSGENEARAAPPTFAARTRIVSAAGIRLAHRESVRSFKGIFCHDISESESYMPSHAVCVSLPTIMTDSRGGDDIPVKDLADRQRVHRIAVVGECEPAVNVSHAERVGSDTATRLGIA